MFKRLVLCVMIGALAGAVAWAQEEAAQKPAASDDTAGAKPDKAPKDGAGAEPAAAESAAPPALPGDVITLKSGKKLAGVQVLRELPNVVEVEVQEGLEPLKLPRKQVVSIQYDDIDPIRQRRLEEMKAAAPGPDIIPGEKLSPEFNLKLKNSLSDAPLSFKDIGFANLLTKLCEQIGVELQIEDSARKLPMDQRIRSFEIKPGTSLFTFLQTDFVTAYPTLTVMYKYDKIIVEGKEAEAGNPAESAPPAPPAAPPAESGQ